MTEEFNLSDKIFGLSDWEKNVGFLKTTDVKEFISLINTKVLTDWKGQNEFIDWLKIKSGEKFK